MHKRIVKEGKAYGNLGSMAMNKRGQFFLIAAFVVIGILLSAGSVYNAVQTPLEETQAYDLSKELAFESYQVIDYGVFNSLESQIKNYLNDLTSSYAKINPENEILTVYGDEENIEVIHHTNIPTGNIGLETQSGTSLNQEIKRRGVRQPTALVFEGKKGKKVKVILDAQKNISHSFDLKRGQNFFLVIKRQRGNDQIIAAQ